MQTLVVAEIDARFKAATKRLPHMCVHNHRHPLDVRKKVEDEVNEMYNRLEKGPRLPVVNTMGLCMLGAESPEEWPGNICEDPIDAQRCPWFTPLVSRDSIIENFSTQLKDLEWVRQAMPELYTLMWVLEASRTKLPWWTRLWCWFARDIVVEPILPPPEL
jgi:hypothetical protein